MKEESFTEVTHLCAIQTTSSISLLGRTGGYIIYGLVGKKSTTREKLFGGSTELDLFVYPVGQVCFFHPLPAGAQTSLQRHPLHVL